MKKLIVAALAMAFTGTTVFAQGLEFTCTTLDRASTVVIKVGAGEDGYPLDSYVVDGVEKADSVVQYIFNLSQNGLMNVINTVDVTDDGRVHSSAGIQATPQGLILQSVSFNVDAENIEASAVEKLYACALPAQEAQTSSAE